MGQQVVSPELVALRRHWGRWTALVKLHARRGRGCERVDPHDYQALRQELVAACRALGAAAGEKRELCQRLEDLVRPWLTARTLEQTDQELLIDLLARCRLAEQELQPRTWLAAARRWAVSAAVFVVIAAVAALLVLTADWKWFPTWESVRDRWQALGLAVRGAVGARWWFVAVAVAILITIVVVSRGGRNTEGP